MNNDIHLDPAILAAYPAPAYQAISLLPEEMIRYELETQGIKSENSLGKVRTQLTEHIMSGKYTNDMQPVALSLEDDFARCLTYLTLWTGEVEKSSRDLKTIQSYLMRIRFLLRRITCLPTPLEHPELKKRIEDLKRDATLFQRELKLAEINILRPDDPTVRDTDMMGNVTNWTMDAHTPLVQSVNTTMAAPVGPNLTSSFLNSPVTLPVIPKRVTISGLPSNSLLDATLGFYEASGSNPTLEGLHQIIGSSTQRAPVAQNPYQSFMTGQPSIIIHKQKVKIHKWGIKFLGEPRTMPLMEFLRRVKELTQSRGASYDDLFHSASDLFEGSALKWYRAANENGLFHSWYDIVAMLMRDFESEDYGDNLFEFIKKRIQLPNERIVVYFATMEDYFIKLNKHISEDLKVKIIRRNLRSEYIRGLGLIACPTVASLKASCHALETDFFRLNNRERDQGKEPDSTPRSVRFHDRVQTLEDPQNPIDGYPDYLDPEFESEHSLRSSSLLSNNRRNRPRSLSPHRNSYEQAFDQRMKDLSIRDDPNLPIHQVPSVDIVKNDQVHQHDQTNRRYFAPSRNNFTDNSRSQIQNHPNHSGNAHGSHQPRAQDTPLLIRRPY